MRQSRGELTSKDMSVLRENDNTRAQHQKTRFPLRDYSMNHQVEIDFALNKEAERDMIFRLKVDGTEVLLDAEEVQRVLRWR